MTNPPDKSAFNAVIRAAAGRSTLGGSGGPGATYLRAAHDYLEAARRSGDPERLAEAEYRMDEAVSTWRAARTDTGDPAPVSRPDFGAGGRGQGVRGEPSMTDKLRADRLGIDPGQLPPHLKTNTGGLDDAA